MMAPLANSLRLVSELKSGQRRLLWALAAAMLLTWVLSLWYTLHLAYHHGAINLFPFGALRHRAFALGGPAPPQSHRAEPSWLAVDWRRGRDYGRLAGGPALPAVVAPAPPRLCRRLWPRDGAHLVCSILGLAEQKVPAAFGGAAAYRRMQPFFLGMALGHISSGGVWLLIDGVTGTVGNRIPLY